MFFRARAKQRNYLRRIPPVEGVPLDMVAGGNPFGAANRAIFQVMGQPQSDLELERLRREVGERTFYFALWTIGFPLAALGVMVLLSLSGVGK